LPIAGDENFYFLVCFLLPTKSFLVLVLGMAWSGFDFEPYVRKGRALDVHSRDRCIPMADWIE
jgi:hypothetical protein